MFDKIVVLLDGSALSKSVLPHTHALVHAFQGRVTVLHVLEPKEKTDTGRLDPLSWHLRKIEAQSFLSDIAQESADKGLVLDTLLLEGTAANRIAEYIAETQPDLVMLSSHGHGGLTPWNVSSLAQKIIYRAFTSFMLVRAYRQPSESQAQARYGRIAVPLDGSRRAEYVLPFAARLAAAHNAELLLIHAQDPLCIQQKHTLSQEETAVIEKLSARNQVEIDRYLAQVAAQTGPEAICQRLDGPNPADVLLEFVNNSDIDLVVMSAHGQSSESKRPYGSIVSSFIAYGGTALLIIQDLSPDQIKPTQAELSAAANSDVGHTNRKIAYAQPANWSNDS